MQELFFVNKKPLEVVNSACPVIHLEIGLSEYWDSHNQKPVSPSDKRVSPIQHLRSIFVQNVLLRSWDVCSFVTGQFP